MRIIENKESLFGDKSCEIVVPEIKTNKESYGLAYNIAGIGSVDCIECMGYLDMDTNENFITFKNRDEFRKNLAEVEKIEANTVNVRFAGDKMNGCVKVATGRVTSVFVIGSGELFNSVLALLKKRFGN